MVTVGSITSTVEGSGTANAKQSESITITTAGTVVDVYVNEGDVVEAGTFFKNASKRLLSSKSGGGVSFPCHFAFFSLGSAVGAKKPMC